MTASSLTLADLVTGLERYGDRYKSLDVLAANVKELDELRRTQRLGRLRVLADRSGLAFEHDGKQYQVRIHAGVARVLRAPGDLGVANETLAIGTLGAAIGAIASESLPGTLLGFLIGAALGEAANSSRRVLTLRYDPDLRTWHAYDGPFAQWMRSRSSEAEPGLG